LACPSLLLADPHDRRQVHAKRNRLFAVVETNSEQPIVREQSDSYTHMTLPTIYPE